MESQFIEKYKSYSNFELLKITQKPDNYQENAVLAANEILKDRVISEEDLSEVEHYYLDKEINIEHKNEYISNLKENIFDFLQPLISPEESLKPVKWLNILLLIIIVQYLYSIFLTIRYLRHIFFAETLIWDFYLTSSIFNLIFVPFVFYFIYKKTKLGWALLFTQKLFVLILSISLLIKFGILGNFKEIFAHYGILHFTYYIAFVLFLLKSSTCDLFDISPTLKRTIATFTIILTLTYIIILNTLF